MRMPAVDVSVAAKGITIEVRLRGLNVLLGRVAIGVFFIKLGAKIAGCNVKMEGEDA